MPLNTKNKMKDQSSAEIIPGNGKEKLMTKQSNNWICSTCKVVNDITKLKCKMCNSVKKPTLTSLKKL